MWTFQRMGRDHWHDVLIQNDEGDKSFAAAAPLLMEALHLVAITRSLPVALRVSCREIELSHVDNSLFAHREAREDAQALRLMLESYLEPVYNSLSHLKSEEPVVQHNHPQPIKQPHQLERQKQILQYHNGLIAPSEMQTDAFLQSHPMFDYAIFYRHFKQLRHIISRGELFSACEPRIKVLQSRYRLYRVFNGFREDRFHSTLGSGSVDRAPKVDVRRVSTCMSANTLIEFMQQMLAKEPDMVLPSKSVLSAVETKRNAILTERDEPQWTVDGSECRCGVWQDDGNPNGEFGPTLKDLVNIFFGPFLPPEERYFTADGLGLLPNYTEAAERWLDVFDMRDATQQSIANSMPLLRHFLDVYSGNGGNLLARIVVPMVSRIATKSSDILELEFTITGRIAGEVEHVASWCVRNELFSSKNVQPSLRIVLQSFSSGDTVSAVKTLEDVLKNIFEPIWLALLQPQGYPEMVDFLGQLASVSVSVRGDADVQEMPTTNDPKMYSMEDGTAPPDAFFIYHVWRNVQILNCMAAVHIFFASTKEGDSAAPATMATGKTVTLKGAEMAVTSEVEPGRVQFFLPEGSLFLRHKPVLSRPLLFRLQTSETRKNSFVEGVMGLLVADEVVNPLEVISWSPLAYLYYLTQRSVVVTPSRNRNVSRESTMQQFLPFFVETGMHASVATLDPLHYHTGDNALCEEFNGLHKEYHFAIAELTELSLHSAESANSSVARRQMMLGGPWERVRARHNDFTTTQVNPLRLHFRESSLVHEMDLLCRKGLTHTSGFIIGKRIKKNAMISHLCFSESGIFQATVEEQREDLWRFFDIPHLMMDAVKKEGSSVLGHRFVDKQIKYPRIRMLGPNIGERSDVARNVAKALFRRQYYQSFSVHYEPLPLATQLQVAQAVKVLLASQGAKAGVGGISFPSPPPEEIRRQQDSGTTSTTSGDADGSCEGRHSSYHLFSSSLTHEQRVVIPTNFCSRNGVRDVDLPEDANDVTKAYFRPLPSWAEFQSDVRRLRSVSAERAMQLYAKKRLGMLECKFNLHVALTNDDEEYDDGGASVLREKGDMYRCTKVDVHCHMAAGMTAKELLRFIKQKVHTHTDDVVDVEAGTGRLITLGEMFATLRPPKLGGAVVNVEDLSVASLEVKAGKGTFNRFDEFNNRYSPLGDSALRSLFLKTDNFMGGRYFAELIRETFRRQAEDGHTFSEYRLSIYGRRRDEWNRLAWWFVLHGMSHPTNRWMLQVPRLYSIYRRNGTVSSFENMLTNIFLPLWEASISPEAHPFLNYFLAHVSGFDSVDNESEREADVLIDQPPACWTSTENPPFTYWMYYMWANITSLNRYRAARGLSTFTFRPHAGESGDPEHMADTFLIADGVNHGINLKDLPVLQYLYYLAQIPLGITPLSNNALFCKYHLNPFPTFFRRGLNVALATDGALTFHHTEQPLIEEYSTAVNFWSLSQADVCEIARNSVLMSGFPSYRKKMWLGDLYALRSPAGNNVRLSKVPQTRCAFRYEVYMEELNYLQARAALCVSMKPVMDPQMEELYVLDTLGLSREEVIERQLSGQSMAGAVTPRPPQPCTDAAPDVSKTSGLHITMMSSL